jgi:hypothetical protein
VATRELVWDGCINVRDLGGHATEDGGETRFGTVVRADSIRKLSDAGWERLVGYGVRTVLDLRFHEELEADPPQELPVDVLHVPVFPDRTDPVWGDVDSMEKGAGYLLLLELGAARFAEAVAAVGDAAEGGVVVHCAVGKDRTGLVAGLLLRLAGVPIAAIAEDYALSERRLAPLIRQWLDEPVPEDERLRRLHISASPRSAMETVLRGLEIEHGSVESFLHAAGASTEALGRARARLRG